MEEIELREQPDSTIDGNVQSEIVEEKSEGISLPKDANGSLGKFKDAESMLKAYNNLQAEFTRKCQRLSELEKESKAEEESKAVAVYSDEKWQEKVELFLKENPQAKEFSGKIANEIASDKSLQTSSNALELAWAKVMQREYKNPETLCHDQNFIREKILSQDEVKQQVLEEYFKSLQKGKVPPVIASSGKTASINYKQPTNMQEAKQLVEKLFNVKG